MITAVRIQNLRSLRDTGYIPIKPLTILLGANSTGKSTFLRSFLLFAQSVNKRLRGPISWFDDSLVDFGDFYTAINAEARENKEPMRFSFKIAKSERDRYPRHQFGFWYAANRASTIPEYEFSISLACVEGETYVNEVTFNEGELDVKATVSSRDAIVQFYVNGKPFKTSEQLKWTYGLYTSILPSFESKNKENEKKAGLSSYEDIRHFIKQRSNKTLKDDSKIYTLTSKSVSNKQELLTYIIEKYTIKSFSNYVIANQWTIESEEFNQLYGYLGICHFLTMFNILDMQLASFYGGSSYIAPARAEANRYYRTQGLQVLDIDPYGRNLQEFIASLDDDQKESYQEYSKKILKVSADTIPHEGHQSIVLKSDLGDFNIADVGFGYSQILPIITKLWYITSDRQHVSGRSRNIYYYGLSEDNTNILIEQPELHLHPAYQARIADAIMEAAKVSKKIKRDKNLIVETHSEVFINRVGRRIKENKFNIEDVNIVLFEKSVGDRNTNVRQMTFKPNGQIQGWPYGFFDPDKD